MIKVIEFTTGYKKIEIVHNVSLTVEKGKITSVIGRNGVGKSTLIKGIVGSLPAMSGNIQFKNKDITTQKPFARAHEGMGYVPQGHAVFPTLSVKDNLIMGETINLNNKKKKNNTYETIYSFFPILKERLSQKAGTLSGGERAQLSIARALIGQPDLLILDEPSEGVQPNIISNIGNIIKQINNDLGLTVLLVEQNINLIKKLSDVCFAMDKGSIVGKHKIEELDHTMIQSYLSI